MITQDDLIKKINSFSNLINELGNTILNSKDIWNRHNEILENFKAAQFIDELQKKEVVQSFEILTEKLREKEIFLANESEFFTKEAEALIDEFEKNSNNILSNTNASKNDFKLIRDISNKAYECFKQKKWASKDRRNIAWEKYNELRNAVKDKEDELYEVERVKYEQTATQSLEITEKLCVLINACHPLVEANVLLETVQKFDAFLTNNQLYKLNIEWYLIQKPEEVKYSLRCQSETLSNIRNFVLTNKDNFLREHKAQIFDTIDGLKEDINIAWKNHKELQQKKQEEWETKKQLNDVKREAWLKNQMEFLQMLQKRLIDQQGYKEKQEKYLSNQQSFLQKFEQRITQQKAYILQLEIQLDDLDKKSQDAWTDSFKTKVEEWIEEKKQKTIDVQNDIIVLKEKIEDIKKNVEYLPNKIEELNQSLVQINLKIDEVHTNIQSSSTTTKKEN